MQHNFGRLQPSWVKASPNGDPDLTLHPDTSVHFYLVVTGLTCKNKRAWLALNTLSFSAYVLLLNQFDYTTGAL